MLQSGTLPEDKRQRAVDTIERNARAQVQLVEDILDVSRIITGKLRLEIDHVEPAQIVESAVDVVRPAADAKGVRLHALIEPNAGTLMADAGRLQQIVWNLLANAVKFTPRGGRVHIRLQRVDSQVELVVADTGVGVDPSFLPYMFQPFQQADATTTRSNGGLGLAIVKHLVELHGGRVEAHSDGVGKGSTFTVRIPIAPTRSRVEGPAVVPSPGAARRGAALSCPPGLHGLRVLVVDDDPDARELLQSVLEQCHADVRTAASVDDALAAIGQEVPEVLVSDIGMPGGGRVRADSPATRAHASGRRPNSRGRVDGLHAPGRSHPRVDGRLHQPREQAGRA